MMDVRRLLIIKSGTAAGHRGSLCSPPSLLRSIPILFAKGRGSAEDQCSLYGWLPGEPAVISLPAVEVGDLATKDSGRWQTKTYANQAREPA